MFIAVAGVPLALLAATACGSSSTSDAGSTASSAPGNGSLYLSLGDSYAAGFQPEPIGSGEGFAQQITERSASTDEPLTLANFGCPGATSSAVLNDIGCETADSVADGYRYPDSTQLAAAIDLMRTHQDRIRLVTISLGGNDIAPCLQEDDPVACARDLAPTIAANLASALSQVREAVGPDVPIVGITYPDVYVRDLASNDPDARARAEASVTIFRDVLNPTLSAAYAAADAGFVDITADSGAYRSIDDVVPTADGTTVPAAAATICQYTHYCESGDVHPNTAGYSFIADQVLALAATTS